MSAFSALLGALFGAAATGYAWYLFGLKTQFAMERRRIYLDFVRSLRGLLEHGSVELRGHVVDLQRELVLYGSDVVVKETEALFRLIEERDDRRDERALRVLAAMRRDLHPRTALTYRDIRLWALGLPHQGHGTR